MILHQDFFFFKKKISPCSELARFLFSIPRLPYKRILNTLLGLPYHKLLLVKSFMDIQHPKQSNLLKKKEDGVLSCTWMLHYSKFLLHVDSDLFRNSIVLLEYQFKWLIPFFPINLNFWDNRWFTCPKFKSWLYSLLSFSVKYFTY